MFSLPFCRVPAAPANVSFSNRQFFVIGSFSSSLTMILVSLAIYENLTFTSIWSVTDVRTNVRTNGHYEPPGAPPAGDGFRIPRARPHVMRERCQNVSRGTRGFAPPLQYDKLYIIYNIYDIYVMIYIMYG